MVFDGSYAMPCRPLYGWCSILGVAMSDPAVAELPEPTPPAAETIAGRYLLEEVIDSDARRVVHRALDEQLQCEIVISVFRSSCEPQRNSSSHRSIEDTPENTRVIASSDERTAAVPASDADRVGRENFDRLAARLATVEHPNLARLLDHGVSGVTCYVVHELLEGESLAVRLAAGEGASGALDRAAVQSIVKQLLAALAALHASGLAHGNLRPASICLQRRLHTSDAVKLLDVAVPLLSAARLSGAAEVPPASAAESGPVVGAAHTLGGPDVLEYSAPECLAGQAPDARSDVYSVGVLLDELLLQSEPHSQAEQLERDLAAMLEASGDADESAAPAARHTLKDPVLQALVARATSTDRSERFADAAELLSALVDAEPRVLGSQPLAPERAPEPHPSIYDDGAFMSETTTVYEPKNSVFVASQELAGLRELNLQQQAPIGRDPTERLRPAAPAPATPAKPPLAAGMLVVMVLSAVLVMWLSSESGGASWRALRPAAQNVEPPAAKLGLKAADGEEPPENAAALDDEDTLAKPEPAAAAPAQPAATETSVSSAVDPTPAPPDKPAPVRGRPAAYNPWSAPVPAELQGLPALIGSNAEVGSDVVHKIRAYGRAQPNDPRGHLLLARVYLHRLWRKDCLLELGQAFRLDPGSRGAPEALPMLLHFVSEGKAAEPASELIASTWGREALPAISAAINEARTVVIAERLHALHDKLSKIQ